MREELPPRKRRGIDFRRISAILQPSSMSGSLAAPPLQPVAGGPRSIGPFKATAEIAAGRRTITFLAHKDDPENLFALRQVRPEVDAETFEAEARGARVF